MQKKIILPKTQNLRKSLYNRVKKCYYKKK